MNLKLIIMMFPQIRCYNANALTQPTVFFILAKGENAGKPSLKPWVNSFAMVCPNEKYFQFYFWLVYALFKARKFKIYLRGTAISFIIKSDIIAILREVAPAVYDDWSKFQELISVLDKLQQLKTSLVQQVETSHRLQTALIEEYFRK